MPTKRPRNLTRRQNRIHEIHAPQIAALRDMIVADALKVPGTTLKIALAIQKRFKKDTPVFLSLETLAAECRVTRKTLFNHFPRIRKRWGIGFYTPSYSQRGAGFSTEVSFPISRVEKYRKYADFCESMGKNVPSFASYLSASKATLKAWVIFTQHTSKVAAPSAAPSLEARSRPRLATEEDSHEGFGTEFWDDSSGKSFWVEATETLPEDFAPAWLGARVENDEGMTGTVIGFPVAGSDERLDYHVLVRYEPQMLDGELTHEVLDWVYLDNITRLDSEPFSIPSPPTVPAAPPHDATDADVVAGTRVRHLKYGDGTCTAIDGTKVTVFFDKYDERKILLAFLQIVDNELAGDILAGAAKVRTEQMTG